MAGSGERRGRESQIPRKPEAQERRQNRGRAMKEIMGGKGRRGAGQHTEMGGQTGKRTPGPKHKRGTEKRSKRRENPKHKTTLKFPHRVRVGVSQGQVAASSHQAHNPPHRGRDCQWAKCKGWRYSPGLGSAGPVAPNPSPSPRTSSPGSRTMGRGGRGHPASIQPGLRVEEAGIPVFTGKGG